MATATEPLVDVPPFDGADEEETPAHDVPKFEGRPVARTVLKLAGLSTLTNEVDPDLQVSVDDRIRLVVVVKVSDVNFGIDKDGELVRNQTAKVVSAERVPFNPNDPEDDGIQRA